MTQVEDRGWLALAERGVNVVNRIFVLAACALLLVVAGIILADVFFRYVQSEPLEWVQDTSCFILAFAFFLGLAPALESGSHVEVDLFDPLIPRPLRKAQRMLGKAITVLFAGVFFYFVARHYAHVVETDELSFGMVMFPLAQVLWIGPLGAFMFLVVAALQFLRFATTPPDSWSEPVVLGH